MRELKEIMQTLLGDRDYCTRDDFQLLSIAVLGHETTNFEIDLIYDDEHILNLTYVISHFKQKLRLINNDNNYYVFKCFRMLDKRCNNHIFDL